MDYIMSFFGLLEQVFQRVQQKCKTQVDEVFAELHFKYQGSTVEERTSM